MDKLMTKDQFKLVDETTTKSIATFRSNLFQSEHNIVVKRFDAYEFTRVSRRKIYGDQMISFFFLSMCVPFSPFLFYSLFYYRLFL